MGGLNGTATVGAPGTAAGWLNTPTYERTMVHEMRARSTFGALARPMKGVTRAGDRGGNDIDVSTTSAVMMKEVNAGDTVRWNLTKRLKGAPTFGDTVPNKGPYLDFWGMELKVNLIKSPAFQYHGEFEKLKMASTGVGDTDSEVRDQLGKWNAEIYSHDHIAASLRGASDNLLASAADGGANMNIGRGAGKQVSPRNIIVLGTGEIGGATLDARESNLKTALNSLSLSNANHLISLSAIGQWNEALSGSGSNLFQGIDRGGQEEFVLVLPTLARWTLQGQSSTLVDFSKYANPLSPEHPLFQYHPIKVGNIVVVFDDTLAKYSPDVTGSEIVWGKDSVDPGSWSYDDLTAAQKTRGIGLIFGGGALRTAQAKTMKLTEEKGRHEVGGEVASKTYRSIVRSQFYDPTDSTKLPIDQSFMLVAFAMPPLKHGAA